MDDVRTRVPECPLEYQIPHIPGSHTALVIEIHAADIDAQEKILPWTLASLINNTDIVMKGVHLYVLCEDGIQARIKTALRRFDLPPGTLRVGNPGADNTPLIVFGEHGYGYDSVCLLDIHYWAFRGLGPRQDIAIKLPFGHVGRHTWSWAVADISLSTANHIDQKDAWVRLANPLPSFPEGRAREKEIRTSLVDASARAKWLHDANRAVYGKDYEKRNKNVAAYFFNEADPNWHLDASILHYSAREVNDPYFADWASEWEHLGTEALIALWLLKTQQHAYNLSDSVTIASNYLRAEGPRLCNMQRATVKDFQDGIQELMGAQLNLKM